MYVSLRNPVLDAFLLHHSITTQFAKHFPDTTSPQTGTANKIQLPATANRTGKTGEC